MQSFDHSRLRKAVPAPSVIARRNREYRSARLLFLYYIVAVLAILSAFTLLLYGGTLLKFWELLLRLHLGLDTWGGLVMLGGLPIAFVGIQVHKVFNEFWSIRGFRHLYRVCRYIDPVQLMQCSLSYVIAARPDRFSYAFSGWVIVVEVRGKGELDIPDSAEIVESEDFSFLDTATDSKQISALRSLGSSEHPALLNASEERETISSPDAALDTNMPALPAPQKDETQLQSQESPELMERETPSDRQQAQVALEAIQEQFRVIISLRETVMLFLIEKNENASKEYPSEKRIAVPIGNVRYLALIAYLARNASEWIDVMVVMDRVYEYERDKSKVQSLFNTHVSRIRKQVREGIRNEFPRWASAAKDFDLFEQRMNGRMRSFWRLSKNCTVSEMDALNNFYNDMLVLAHSKRTRPIKDPIKEKKLLGDAKRLIKHYSGNYLEKYPEDEEGYVGGYLIEHLHELPFRGWAVSFFNECRQKYIFCLEQVAEREHLLWQEVKQPEYLSNAAKFYKECAYAATCAPIDSAHGEHALRSGLLLYQEAGEIGEADTFYETYRRRMFKAQSEWSPEKETRALLYKINLTEKE